VTYEEFVLDDALERFDFAACHAWLTSAYWSPGITRAEVEHGFHNSALVAGAYRDDIQVACMRVASDRTRFAYVMDVFVDPGSRGRGLGKALMRFALEHPELALVYKWLLGTADAHELYRAVGFDDFPRPERLLYLERSRPWLKESTDQ
jgi:GNAT superfamily N-acetyltransferase